MSGSTFRHSAAAVVDRITEAKDQAQKAIELNPNDSLMLYNAACFYSRIGDKEKALEMFKNAIDSGHQDYEWFDTL